MRTFELKPAVREATPLLVGIVGPSGTGKTYSALELAMGIQAVCGGDIGVIDTEAKRALHYADYFKFHHLDFQPPHSPLDYLDAINHVRNKGCRTIIVDSTSHEHEGQGGVLEMHESETQRLMQAWRKDNPDVVKMAAWQKPKADRRKLINSILQMRCNFIFCFRAKEKLKVLGGGKAPEQLGWMAIAGDEFIYEMTVKFALLPGARDRGVPTWESTYPGEKSMMKLPVQFKDTFKPGVQLNRKLGEEMARWAQGGVAPQSPPPPPQQQGQKQKSDPPPSQAIVDQVKGLVAKYEVAANMEVFAALEKVRGELWDQVDLRGKNHLQAAVDRARARLADPAAVDVPL